LCICQGEKCVKTLTIDAGPNISVNIQANKDIIDASAAVCEELTG